MTRQEAIEVLKDNAVVYCNSENCIFKCEECYESLNMAIEALEQEPKRGKWVQAKDVEIEYAVCTNCTHHGEFYMRYCPNCGARMESDEE